MGGERGGMRIVHDHEMEKRYEGGEHRREEEGRQGKGIGMSVERKKEREISNTRMEVTHLVGMRKRPPVGNTICNYQRKLSEQTQLNNKLLQAYLLAGLRDADIFETINNLIRIGRHLR